MSACHSVKIDQAGNFEGNPINEHLSVEKPPNPTIVVRRSFMPAETGKGQVGRDVILVAQHPTQQMTYSWHAC